jgi:hypothetical protein
MPKILSNEPSIDVLEECVAVGANYVCHDFESAREAYKRGQLAQLDADVAYYEDEEKKMVDSWTQTVREMVAQNKLEIQQAKEEARFNLLEWFRNYAHRLEAKFPYPTPEEQGWLGNIWDMIRMAGKEDAEIDFIQQAKAEAAREMIEDLRKKLTMGRDGYYELYKADLKYLESKYTGGQK